MLQSFSKGKIVMKARKYTRFPTNIPVSLTIDNMMGDHKLYLSNASQGGLSFNAHGCIDRGTRLNVRFSENDDQVTRGKIAWCQPVDGGQCRIGMQFDTMMNRTTIEKMALKR